MEIVVCLKRTIQCGCLDLDLMMRQALKFQPKPNRLWKDQDQLWFLSSNQFLMLIIYRWVLWDLIFYFSFNDYEISNKWSPIPILAQKRKTLKFYPDWLIVIKLKEGLEEPKGYRHGSGTRHTIWQCPNF